MSDVLNLTSFDQIRGVLAVTVADLPDATLAPMALEDDLQSDLEEWLVDWETVRDGNDMAKARVLRLYAKCRVAAIVAVAAQHFVLTQMTDGANAGQRSDQDGFQLVRLQLEARADRYKQQLLTLHVATSVVETARPLFGAVRPSRDPVTEGRS